MAENYLTNKDFEPKNSISESKNTNLGNFNNTRNNIFGDGNVINENFDAVEYLAESLENPVFKKFIQIDRKEEIKKLKTEFQKGQRFFFFKTDKKHRLKWFFYRFFYELINLPDCKNFEFQKKEIYLEIDKGENAVSVQNDLLGAFGKNIVSSKDVLDSLDKQKFWVLNFHIDSELDNAALRKLEKEFIEFWTGESEADYKNIFEKNKILVFFTIDIQYKRGFNWFFARTKAKLLNFVYCNFSELSLITQRHVDQLYKDISIPLHKENLFMIEAWYELQPFIAKCFNYLDKNKTSQ